MVKDNLLCGSGSGSIFIIDLKSFSLKEEISIGFIAKIIKLVSVGNETIGICTNSGLCVAKIGHGGVQIQSKVKAGFIILTGVAVIGGSERIAILP
jgi:hypothetical protein